MGLVVREDMEERCYRATKGVVLCAGGFVMNEMMQRYAPELAKAGTVPLVTQTIRVVVFRWASV